MGSMLQMGHTHCLSSCNSVHVSGWLWFIAHTLCTVSPSSDAHTPINIDSQPNLEDISKFVVHKIAADWKQVAVYLGVEPSVISTADAEHSQCEHACTDIFERWLSWKPGTGRKKEIDALFSQQWTRLDTRFTVSRDVPPPVSSEPAQY